MRDDAIRCLEDQYPHTFDQFHAAITARGHDLESTHPNMNYVGSELDYMNLAHEFSLTRVLPVLFYIISDWNRGEAARGLVRKSCIGGELVDGGGIACLTGDLLTAHFRGRSQLLEKQQAMVLGLSGVESCLTPSSCAITRRDILIALNIPDFKCILLLPWQSVDMRINKRILVLWDNLCACCLAEAQRLHEIYRQDTWDNLPVYFGLPTWQQILAGPAEG
jgi:hypothetical protein